MELVPDAGHDPARRRRRRLLRPLRLPFPPIGHENAGVLSRNRTDGRRGHIPERYHCAMGTTELVGMAGFDPATSCSPSRRAPRLRYIPMNWSPRRGSNSRPHAPKARALPTALRGGESGRCGRV